MQETARATSLAEQIQQITTEKEKTETDAKRTIHALQEKSEQLEGLLDLAKLETVAERKTSQQIISEFLEKPATQPNFSLWSVVRQTKLAVLFH